MGLHSLRILDTAPEERFDRITRMAQRYFGVVTCLISLVDTNRQWFKSKQGLDACETSRDVSFCGHAILGDEIFVVEDAIKDTRFADNPLVTGSPAIRFYAGCPIHGPGGHRIGTLCLIDPSPRSLDPEDADTLRDFAAMVEDELALVSQTSVDELTGLSNRRGFNAIAEHILPLCQRLGMPAEMLFFDLDGFKQVNDELGHEAGDRMLCQFATLLTKCFRTADVIARLGGDEFVVLMAGSDSSSSAALDRLDCMSRSTSTDSPARLRWSVGRVDYSAEDHPDVDTLVASADQCMYDDKRTKRHEVGWSV
jgi:diguanylate cyclase (GGDEF)-like protein